MKGIVMHCRRFEYKDTARSTWPQGVVTTNFGGERFENLVVVLTCIEKGDTKQYVESAVERVKSLNSQFYKRDKIVICPFAHLSNKLEEARNAIPLINYFKKMLKKEGFGVGTASFGTDKDALFDVIGKRATVSFFEFPFEGKPGVMENNSPDFLWDPVKYKTLIEECDDKHMKMFQAVEKGLLDKISGMDKTLIEVGAGYGRAVKENSMMYGNTIAIETDVNMFNHLSSEYSSRKDITLVNGDAADLNQIIKGQCKPVVTFLQNTLGTWKGNWRESLENAIIFTKRHHGEIVISLFPQFSLSSWGLGLYDHLSPLVGEYDSDSSDLDKGDFRTKSNYYAHWWSKDERNVIRSLLKGAKTRIYSTEQYWIIHADYSFVKE